VPVRTRYIPILEASGNDLRMISKRKEGGSRERETLMTLCPCTISQFPLWSIMMIFYQRCTMACIFGVWSKSACNSNSKSTKTMKKCFRIGTGKHFIRKLSHIVWAGCVTRKCISHVLGTHIFVSCLIGGRPVGVHVPFLLLSIQFLLMILTCLNPRAMPLPERRILSMYTKQQTYSVFRPPIIL
jgi:hypothetical protein